MKESAGSLNSPISKESVSPWLVLLLAVACGLIAGNIYYSQPLAGLISTTLGFSKGATGLIVTMTQIGTGLGLLFIVPLGDLIESRRLAIILLSIAALGLWGAAVSWDPLSYLISACLIGLGSVAIHVLVPYTAHIAPEQIRGRVVGSVMSGVLVGIMLSRPLSSFVTQLSSSWHVIFYLSAAMMVALALVLTWVLPPRRPMTQHGYGQLLASMRQIVVTEPIVRRRSMYHGCLGASFSLFWTTIPLVLTGPAFNLSQAGIALFALVGVAGAITAPLTGIVADRGWTRPATVLAMLAVVAALVLTRIGHTGSTESLTFMAVAGIVLDAGVSANMALGQRAIFALGPQFRSRVNGIYMTTFFTGSAFGSALGGWSYALGGWNFTSMIGIAFPVAALLYVATDRRRPAQGQGEPSVSVRHHTESR